MAETTSWPPIGWLWKQHRINGAWYAGDPERLAGVSSFWAGEDKRKVHVPIAADLAAMAAGLIFSGSPNITHEDEATNERLQELTELTGLYQQLLQAAELASVYGGVFLKLNWDAALAQRPIVSVVPGDTGLPTFKQGINTANTFWSRVRHDETTGAIWRLEEKYASDGTITSRLFKGDAENKGKEMPLSSIDETKGVLSRVDSGTGKLLSVYIPNRLPNRAAPAQRFGSSDFEGLYNLFAALDEAYTSWERDVRLGKTRIIVPMEFLRKRQSIREALDERGTPEWAFSSSDEVFTALDINPEDRGAGITVVQPSIRADEHAKTVEDIIRKIYQLAGYSPQSAGMDIEGRAESGTALNVRERRSLQTAEAKKTYWWHALVNFVGAMLALDASVFHTGVKTDDKITVTFADSTQPDLATISETVLRLDQANAASVETKVRLVHPDWGDDDVAAEVKRIRHEAGEDTDDEPPDPGMGDNESDPPTGDDAE